jgi:hypothetical protein
MKPIQVSSPCQMADAASRERAPWGAFIRASGIREE